jgi:uroporphyrinogen-III synthase
VRLLVTRPEPDGGRTAEALHAQGHDVLLAPMLHMEHVDFELPDRSYTAVIMTSANTARALQTRPCRARLTSVPAFTVGDHTAAAARALGFAEVHSSDGNRNDLAKTLAARFDASHATLLYLAGENISGDLALPPGTATVVTVVVYRMKKADRFPEAVQTALIRGQIDAVLHFSKRSAEAYIECARFSEVTERALAPLHYCLSQQVAAPLAAYGASRIKIAARPNEAALIELVDS